jgi:single-strand DNA-binding protein
MSGSTFVVIVGRLTRDAELKYTPQGTAVVKFTLANSEKRKVKGEWQEASAFWDCEYWGKPAEAIAQYLTKGKEIITQGAMRQETWEQEGVKRMKTVTTATHVILGAKTAPTTSQEASEPQPRIAAQPEPAGEFTDDIPF